MAPPSSGKSATSSHSRQAARAVGTADVDGYNNLILQCRKHHKQVDDQRSHFTVERLKEIKREHEEREASRDANGPVRLIPDPTKPALKLLKVWDHLMSQQTLAPVRARSQYQ